MTNLDLTFDVLRTLLLAHSERLTVCDDTSERFRLKATPGPATVAAWRGEMRRATICVAWVERRKADIGFHLMGLYGNVALVERLSPKLRARMHGKTCFNFKQCDSGLLSELGVVTGESIAAMRRTGFVAP